MVNPNTPMLERELQEYDFCGKTQKELLALMASLEIDHVERKELTDVN